MIRYAVLGDHGLVIGTGLAATVDEMIASAPTGFRSEGLGDDEHPVAMRAMLGDDDEFHAIPEQPSPFHKWTGRSWIDPRPIDEVQEIAQAALRVERDRRLAASDWTQFSDAALTEAERADWQEYRQALRDMPEATQDPFAPFWPEKP